MKQIQCAQRELILGRSGVGRIYVTEYLPNPQISTIGEVITPESETATITTVYSTQVT